MNTAQQQNTFKRDMTSHPQTRREFLKRDRVACHGGGSPACDRGLAAETPPGQLPKIKLGQLEVSRLILGSNPFFGFSHGNPQAKPDEMKTWYSRTCHGGVGPGGRPRHHRRLDALL